MATIKSNVEQVGHQMLDDLDARMMAAARRAMATTGIAGEALAKENLEKEAYDTGRLLNSVTHEIAEIAPGLLKLTVGTNLDYAVSVEFGRKPGKFPPLDALVGWTARKLKEGGIGATVNVSYNELKEMARVPKGQKATASQKAARVHMGLIYMVGRKIATKGIRGKFIFQRMEDDLNDMFRREFEKELQSGQ